MILCIWLALSMNFTNEQHFEKFVHKGLSLAIYLNTCSMAMVWLPKMSLEPALCRSHVWVSTGEQSLETISSENHLEIQTCSLKTSWKNRLPHISTNSYQK